MSKEPTHPKEKVNPETLRALFDKTAEIFISDESFAFSRASESAFYQCLFLIGQFQGIPFNPLKEKRHEQAEDPSHVIDAFCREANASFREVVLNRDLINKSPVPFLAFLKKNSKPVCLMPVREGGLVLIEPGSKERSLLTPDSFSLLKPLGFQFYRNFKESKVGPLYLLRFGLKNAKRELFLICATAFMATAVNLLFPLSNQLLFDTIIPDLKFSLFNQLLLSLGIAALGMLAFYIVRSLAETRLTGIVENTLQMAFWKKIISLPASFFRKYSSGDLMLRLTLFDQLRRQLTGPLVRLFITPVAALCFAILMIVYSPFLAAIALFLTSLSLAITAYYIIYLLPIMRRLTEKGAELQGFLMQLVVGISKLRATGSEIFAFKYWGELFTDIEKDKLKAKKAEVIASLIQSFFPPVTTLILYLAAFPLLTASDGREPQLTIGELLAFLSAFGAFSLAFSDLIGSAGGLFASIPLIERVEVILKEGAETKEFQRPVRNLEGRVELTNISFQYPDQPVPLLHNVNLTLRRGEFVAIRGRSGSGKSTLIRLLLGLEVPTSGEVFFDGIDLSAIDPSSLRARIGCFLQNSQVFIGTIRDNIMLGRPLSEEEVQSALVDSGFNEVIKTLPMGLDTVLPSGGATLSGGEKARLILARALAHKPDILLLDEPTAALDAVRERELMSRILKLPQTKLIVSHRKSTLSFAERILTLDRGKLE
ncbi:peptidase domain-containing ABC transporter [Estrella lausannensis]|uniref:ABC-type transporter, ATPase subunit n=1 Tax=Estrella lausannensis TaxID=483423 RepID=A0A0H5E517_9BACT|nr:peptidase domain-containing ABC transporter [Estrella lausannensis]CRX38335.1 ABC-type transporter, ATPase subunit [Estrella lausannensis]